MIFSMIVTLSLLGAVSGLIYLFLIWNFDYWKKQGVKGPKPIPFYGNLPNLIKHKRNVAYDLQDIYRQYRHDEDFVGIFTSRSPQLLLTSPDLVHKVLVTDFKSFHDNEASTWFDKDSDKILGMNPFILRGEEWKERRQEITPGLTVSRIKAVYPVTQKVCENLVAYIKEKCESATNTGIDVKDLCLRYTSEVVTDCVLGIKAKSLSDNPTPILKMTKKLFEQSTIFSVYGFFAGLWPRIKSFYKAKFFSKETEKFFSELMETAIDIRRKNSVEYADRIDFLNYILQMQEKKHIPTEYLTSHSMSFLIDGFETSASVITGCLYQLAKYPATQEKLRKEILNNLNNKNELEFDKVDALNYLDQCLYEGMRILPPQLFAKKLCTEVFELTNKNGNKIRIKPDDVILIPSYALCHDELYFPNPNEFIPERFNPENGGFKKFRDMGAFIPFGDGPRACLGMKFAQIQTKAALAMIVKNFNIKLNSKTRKDNRLDPAYFLGALDGGVWLDFEEIIEH